MAILPIRMYGDPVLREVAAPVDVVDDSIRKLIADMAETLEAVEGAGLAAPQVGVQRRVFIYAIGEDKDLHALINPEIVERSDDVIVSEEACLSIPGIGYPVPRARQVRIRALDQDGQTVEYDAEELEARVILHENDHLNGVLYLDLITAEERKEALGILRQRILDDPSSSAPKTPVART